MARKKTKRESPQARAAFAKYAAMGDTRSLTQLLLQFRRDKEEGKFFPTVSIVTIRRWSADFHWQTRVKEVDERTEEQVLDQLVQRRVDARTHSLNLIEKAIAGIEALIDGEGFADLSIKDLKDLVELRMRLLGEPVPLAPRPAGPALPAPTSAVLVVPTFGQADLLRQDPPKRFPPTEVQPAPRALPDADVMAKKLQAANPETIDNQTEEE